MKRKVIATLLTVIMTVGLVAGCGASQDDSSTTGDDSNSSSGNAKVTLRVLSTMEICGQETMDLFMEEYPDINIDFTYVPATDYTAKFSAMASSNEMPDVFWTQAGYYTDQIKDGMLMNLADALDSDAYEGDMSWRDTYDEQLIENLEAMAEMATGDENDVDYGVPFALTTTAVLYDQAIYDELGLSIPTTWDEFMSNCEALKNAGYTPIAQQNNSCVDWWPRLFWDQYCRQEMEVEGKNFEDGSMTFNTESVRQGMEAYKTLWDDGYLPESAMTADLQAVQQMFIQGELAQILITPSKIEYIMENAPDTMKLATYTLPGILDLPARSLGGSSNIWAINADTQYPEESLLLLKFITSRTNYNTNPILRYTVSGLKGVEKDAEVQTILEAFEQAAENGFIPDIYVPVTVSTEIKTAFMSDLIPNYLNGTYDLDYVCNELQSMYDEYLKSNS
ncbi:MAG TPA: extracellular solute-binding protein [Candidatus Mediterraneibacter cottocaccae]|nr:extracellular solute-binding protein [Candidatus Mediterraneibacter cottocaccae]